MSCKLICFETPEGFDAGGDCSKCTRADRLKTEASSVQVDGLVRKRNLGTDGKAICYQCTIGIENEIIYTHEPERSICYKCGREVFGDRTHVEKASV